MAKKYDSYGNPLAGNGYTVNRNGMQVDSRGYAVSNSADYGGDFYIGQVPGTPFHSQAGYGDYGEGSENAVAGVPGAAVPGTAGIGTGTAGILGGISESSSRRITGGVSGSYQSGDKYAGVGSAQSYTPDYSLHYTEGPAGQAYVNAMRRIGEDLGSRPIYDNRYDRELEAAYNNIVNRGPFRYNADDDPFYQRYRDRYTELGRLAMRDTMGQAAALTGGYGNTYAQFAGQGAYNQYMSALADKSLELEDRAYQRWADAGDELYRQYSLLGDLRDTEYGRYRDAVSDYNYNLVLLQAKEAEDYARAQYINNLRIEGEQTGYNRWRDAVSDARYEDELGYSRWRDSVSDARYEDETAYSRGRDAIEDSRWDQEFALKQMQAESSGSGRSSGSSGRSGGTGGGTSASGIGGGYSYSDFPEEIVGYDGITGQPIRGNIYSEAQQQWLEDSLNRGYVDENGIYHDPVAKIRTVR